MPEALHLAVCIPTYRRSHLLRLLIEDLSHQTVSIDRLIVVDGDASSERVPDLLETVRCEAGEVLYVPSNHANLPYQRYLGWRVAAGSDRLVYLDDDLRLTSPQSIETLIRPLRATGGRVVGVTAEFETGSAELAAEVHAPRRNAQAAPARWKTWIRRLGSSNRISPGGLSPAGHRRPIESRDKLYAAVGCLRGGAMAYRMSAITADCFSDAMFAMAEHGWGLGEDTLLSRRIGSRGILLTALRSGIVHPGNHEAVAYRRDPFGHGYAAAYSRRLLNDHFRGFDPPSWSDRLTLFKSYAANTVLNWMAAARRPNRNTRALAWGYTLGAVRGLLEPPDSRRICPAIDWRADAEAALARTRTLSPVFA